jgi:nitrite reductase/ring-hydroxylating ferredoxin subunit
MLVCPLHAWKFDLRTGQALYGDRNLATVHVRLTRDGDIVLALGPDGEPR